MVDPELLKILVCPENKASVQLVEDDVVAKINTAIEGGSVANRAGEKVEAPIEAGLLREDGAFLYPIRDDIPIMLIDEAIPFEAFG